MRNKYSNKVYAYIAMIIVFIVSTIALCYGGKDLFLDRAMSCRYKYKFSRSDIC